MRPKSGMKRPSTPVSFMRRSTISVMLRDSSSSRNSRLASGLARKSASMRRRLRVTARKASGCSGRLKRSAVQNRRMMFTGSRAKASSSLTLTRSWSMVKPSREPRLGAAPQPPEKAVEHRGRLGLALLQRRADDGGQIAHVLGDEKVMLHEAFDAREAAAVVIAEPRRQHRLNVEGEPLLGAAGREMQMTAHPPQKFLAALEQAELRRGEQPRRDQLPRLADVIDIFADPEQRVEVAQAALCLPSHWVRRDNARRRPAARAHRVRRASR